MGSPFLVGVQASTEGITRISGTDVGNLLIRVGEAPGARVLKLYRRRRSRFRQTLAGFSHRFIEGKRGVNASARCETERLSLDLWRGEGFDVPARFDEAAPLWVKDPFLWLEHVPGERVYNLVRRDDTPEATKESIVTRLGDQDRRRHLRAVELEQPLLLHEHPTTKHTLLWQDRLITIDLEGAYRPRYPVMRAIGHELAGVIRSLWIDGQESCFASPLTRLYRDAYGDRDLMRRACQAMLDPHSVRMRFKNMSDRRRRRTRSKGEVMRQLLSVL